MLQDQIEFHNVGALESTPGHSGLSLVRIPKRVRHQLNDRARFIGMESVGCELRFKSNSTYLVQPEKWIFYLQIIEIQLFDIEKPCKIIMLFYKITLQNAILSCRNDQSRAIQNRSSF